MLAPANPEEQSILAAEAPSPVEVPLPGRRVVVYSADPTEAATSVLRLAGPLTLAGFEVVWGKEGDQVNVDLVGTAGWVVIQRNFAQMAQAYEQIMARARERGIPVIYESDDLIMELPEGHLLEDALADHVLMIARSAAEADLITVATPFLADCYRAFHPRIEVLPIYLDDRLWNAADLPLPKPEEDGPVVIGYIAGPTHKADIEMLQPVFARLLGQYGKRVSFHFWGCPPPDALADHPQAVYTPVDFLSYAEYVRYAQDLRADIWVAPLVETRFNRAKSPTKYLEFSAIGGAGVYSCLNPYEEVVEHGKNGLLAANEEEWTRCLSLLIDRPDLRARIAANARQDVLNRRLSLHAARWAEVYQKAAEAQGQADPERQSRLDTMSRLVGRVERRHDELQQAIQTLWQTVYDFRDQAAGLSQELKSREAEIASLQERYAAEGAREVALAEQLNAVTRQAQERGEQLAAEAWVLAEVRQQLDAANAGITLRDEEIKRLAGEAAALNAQVRDILNSRSWKVTKIFRAAASLFKPRKKDSTRP